MSENNFPTGAGIASSASAFAALALAASKAAGLDLPEAELSRLARRGSGSACRSIPGGFVEWQSGTGDEDSFAVSISPPDHWALADCIAVVSAEHKPTGSTEGHALAGTSPLQNARVADAPRRLDVCREAILNRDFNMLAEIIEHDFEPDARRDDDLAPGIVLLGACHAEGDGRRPHVAQETACRPLTPSTQVRTCTSSARRKQLQDIRDRLSALPGVSRVLTAGVGGAAQVVK